MAFMLFGFIQCWLQSLYHRAKQRLRQWTRPDDSSASLAIGTARDLTRSKSELILENALLRQQPIDLGFDDNLVLQPGSMNSDRAAKSY